MDNLTTDNLTTDNLTTDNLTMDNLTMDNLTMDNLTMDNLTMDNLTMDNLTMDNLTMDNFNIHYSQMRTYHSTKKLNTDTTKFYVLPPQTNKTADYAALTKVPRQCQRIYRCVIYRMCIVMQLLSRHIRTSR